MATKSAAEQFKDPSSNNSITRNEEGNSRHASNWTYVTGNLRDTQCNKNPGHKDFFPIKSLSRHNLPTPFQSDDWVHMLKARAADTVRLTIEKTSKDRPDHLSTPGAKHGPMNVRRGSGTAFWSRDNLRVIPCPLPGCTLGGPDHNVIGPFNIVTVGHLVFDKTEALATTVEFFYDDPEDRSSVCYAQVVDVVQELDNNRSILRCVTHDFSLPKRLEEARQEKDRLMMKVQEPEDAQMVVLISHPHGVSKCVTVGMLRSLDALGPVKSTIDGKLHLRNCTLAYTTATCPGSGGGSVTLWQRGRRAFAPHGYSIAPDENQSTLGWVGLPDCK